MKIKFIILVLAIANLFLLMPQSTQAFNVADEADAIAVRILPNPNHYNAARWYKSQGFQGSPQSLLVDGYDAVRDGRTVYVNAANVDLVNQTIYTNIYLISYNQSPDFKTVDVLGQIIKNWRFNSNLNTPGQCNISTLLCEQDSDCSQGHTCIGAGETPGRCQPVDGQACYTDAECADGVYCDSLRAKVNRDVRRLGILGDLRELLSNFKKANNRYPVLDSGTYLSLRTVSVWPSWQALFLPQIGATPNSLDPINALGVCPGYEASTCWNKDTNSFADPQPLNNELELPVGSNAFVYTSDANGSNYSLCAGMETKNLGYNTTEGQLAASGCVDSGSAYIGSSDNLAPVLISATLQGTQDQVFSGFIRVIDPENNYLNWSINTSGNDWSTWSAAPILQDTANPNQKRIYAQKAGVPGAYNISLNVSDVYGGVLATVTPITILNNPPLVQGNDVNYYPSTVIPLTISFSIKDSDHPLTYSFTKAIWNSGPFDLLDSSRANFLGETSNRVGDTINYTLRYNLLDSNNFPNDVNFVYTVNARDRYNNSTDKQINIKIKADPPALDFNCNKNVRVGSPYYCGLGWGKQGDHTITYSATGTLPTGLSIAEASNLYEPGIEDPGISRNLWQNFKNIFKLIAHRFQSSALAASPIRLFYALQGTPTVAGQGLLVGILAENEFGAISEKTFSLNVNNYCGDSILQKPNTEGKGGFYNDGNEDCDGLAGLTTDATISNPNLQYCCTTVAGTNYPITTTDKCIFSPVLEGGGFCGDGFCSTNFENTVNCNSDCGQSGTTNTPPLSYSCTYGGGDAIDSIGGGNGAGGDVQGDTGNNIDEEDLGQEEIIPDPEGTATCAPFEYAGQTYEAALINGQCWMTENLNVGTYVASGATPGSGVTIRKYCYNDNPTNCDLYGALYSRYTATQGPNIANQGICPSGWHIPIDQEWHTLENSLATSTCDPSRLGPIGCSPAGTILKNGDFNGTLAGYYNGTSLSFADLNNSVFYWSSSTTFSSTNNPNRFIFRGLNNFSIVHRDITNADNGFYLRCIKN